MRKDGLVRRGETKHGRGLRTRGVPGDRGFGSSDCVARNSGVWECGRSETAGCPAMWSHHAPTAVDTGRKSYVGVTGSGR